TDGRYLYLLVNNKLVILDAWPAANLTRVSETALDGNALVEYLSGDRLTVITQDYRHDPAPAGKDWAGISRPVGYRRYWSHPVVKVTVYDLSDRAAPAVVQETTLDGWYNNSRAIANTVYVAVN